MTPTSDDIPSAQECFRRGRLLQERSRFADAVKWYQLALQSDANHAYSYAMLAMCWSHDPAKQNESVHAARQAVALEPEDSFFRGVLALMLAAKAKEGQTSALSLALGEALMAVKLDPDDSFAHAVEARIQLSLRDFPKAELAARKALSLNTENTMAAEVLSIALLQQHKDEDNAGLVRYQLSQNPEDASSHTSAGWLALRQGKQKVANTHFMEALRYDPTSEGARLGLVESYRARSFIYRGYVQFCHFMSRFSGSGQTGILVGGYFVFRLIYNQVAAVSPGAAVMLAIAWIVLALWSHLARGVGSFFMIFDRFARQALRPKELWEGIAVGGFVLLAAVFLVKTFLTLRVVDEEAAIVLFLSAVPVAAAFTNDHYWGKWLYITAAVVAGGSALMVANPLLSHAWRTEFFQTALYTSIAVSWLRMFRVAYH